MRHFKISILVSLLLLIMSGCGQRGPLYLPQDEPEPTETPQQSSSQSIEALTISSYLQANVVSIPAVAFICEGA